VILFYAKSDPHCWNMVHQAYDEGYLGAKYRHEDERGTYRLSDLTAAGETKGDSSKPWKGFDPAKLGRHWAAPRQANEIIPHRDWEELNTQEKLDLLDKHGFIYWTPRGRNGGTGFPQYKRYLSGGIPIQDVIADIPPINSQAAERLGYPTQKPLELLKRIIAASSNPGDVILDPFCGCGTTIDAVETLNREKRRKHRRRWIGIDLTHIAINLIKHRLTRFDPPPVYEMIGEPASLAAAANLAKNDPYQFQFWALGLVGARPMGGKRKKGADQGIDGVRYFVDELTRKQSVMKRMLVQVKGGHVKSGDIRDLVGTLAREGAEMAVFITMEEPSDPMKSEAATAGMYTSPWDKKTYPKVQVLTIEQLLADPYRPNPRCLLVPGGVAGPNATLGEAPKHRGRTRQAKLGFDTPAPPADESTQ
jgi:site-specific DNA-methyltransferase (adenine-specific)